MQGGVPYYETSIDSGVTRGLYHDVMETNFNVGGEGSTSPSVRSLQMSLLVLKDKVGEVESYLSFFLAQENHYPAQGHLVDQPNNLMAFSSMANLMHIIVETASCMMVNFQQMALESTQATNMNNKFTLHVDQEPDTMQHAFNGVDEGLLNEDNLYNWYNCNTTYNNNDFAVGNTSSSATPTTVEEETNEGDEEVVEVDAEDLLARYTHYCQVCGRGFKREANLRMHMKAHGDMYKSSALVSNNPMKMKMNNADNTAPKKYSCPQEGCKWNKNHVNFQPLKSMVCVKNHYKRSHCPKMFVCKRCNTKEFSVLSDLKTHEKHCGEMKWYCSCGISFTKKDKLMDHVAMFFGHTPLNTSGYQFEQTSWEQG